MPKGKVLQHCCQHKCPGTNFALKKMSKHPLQNRLRASLRHYQHGILQQGWAGALPLVAAVLPSTVMAREGWKKKNREYLYVPSENPDPWSYAYLSAQPIGAQTASHVKCLPNITGPLQTLVDPIDTGEHHCRPLTNRHQRWFCSTK